jgi:hypothetical protein
MPGTLVLFLAIVIISGSISLATVILYDQSFSRRRYSERVLDQERQHSQRLVESPSMRSRVDRYQDSRNRRAA